MSSSCAGSNSPARICPLAEIEPIQIMGYADRLAVRPGEKIAFKVSLESGADRYRAHIVRLICGDDRPDGPGFREQEIDAAVNGEHAGRRQAIDCGSYVLVPGDAALDRPGRFTLAALVWPTLPGTGEQTILGGGGYRLGLDADGRLTLHLDGWQLAAKHPLHPRRWYRILASLDAGKAVIHYEALDRVLGDAGSETCRAKPPAAKDVPTGQPFLIGAHLGEQGHSAGHFNGKIEAPCLVAEALAPADLAALLDRPRDFPLLAAWDFARDIETVVIRDIGPRGLHGRAVNLPARGVTGHRWVGPQHQLARGPGRLRRHPFP